MRRNPLRVLVCGASGRMGRAVRGEIAVSPEFKFAGGVDPAAAAADESPKEFSRLLSGADVVVDFSTPAAASGYSLVCAQARKPFVSGTTGLTDKQLCVLKKAALRIPVFFSPNMSPAVNLTFALAAFAARRLADFDVHISETHHSAKLDAPSGTALRYCERIAAVRGGAKPTITSVRAGDIIGDHAVLYAGPHERVEIIHRAHSRSVFASGALRAAAWLVGRRPGFYDYSDLLELKDIGL